MIKKIFDLKKIVIPKKSISYISFGLIILGIIAGSIFFITISKSDKKYAMDQIINFFNNINNNKIVSGLALKNSLINNIIYILIIYILGLTIIGIPLIIFLIFFKSFIISFSITTIISVYGYKGIIACLLYIFPHQLINIFTVLLIGIYSIMSSINLIKLIFTKEKFNFKLYLKKYSIILLITLSLSIISSLMEAYLYPFLMKMIIKLFI